MAPNRRKFKKFDVGLNMQAPPAAGQAGFEFIRTDARLESKVFDCSPIALPTDYRPPDQIFDHIDLVKAYLLAGANDRDVEIAEFDSRFRACFPKTFEVFQVVLLDDFYQRKKDEYVKQCKIAVASFIEFVGFKPEEEEARLEAVHQFRLKMANIMTLFQEFVEARSKNPNATDRQLSESLLGRVHFAVSVGRDGTISIPGFCSFQQSHSEFINYLQYFCSKLEDLNP